MICVGIDVAKDKHDCFILSSEGEVLADVFTIQNNAEGFDMLLQTIRRCARPEDKIKVGLERFGVWLRKRAGADGDSGFLNAFLTASLTVCIGAMAVVGAINDGLFGDISLLVTKSILDAIIIMVMSATMGKGCIFSAIPVAIFQGLVTLFARFLQPIMTAQATSNLALTGSILVFCVGVNLIWDQQRLKVANMLPTLIFAVALAFVL